MTRQLLMKAADRSEHAPLTVRFASKSGRGREVPESDAVHLLKKQNTGHGDTGDTGNTGNTGDEKSGELLDGDTTQQNDDTKQHDNDTTQQNDDTKQHDNDTTQQNDDTKQHDNDTTQQNDDTKQHDNDTTQQNDDTKQHDNDTTQDVQQPDRALRRWCVHQNTRHGMKTLTREFVCDVAGALMGASRFKVDLTSPEVVILVELSPVLCGAAVCKDFHKLSKYNIYRLCHPDEETQAKTDT